RDVPAGRGGPRPGQPVADLRTDGSPARNQLAGPEVLRLLLLHAREAPDRRHRRANGGRETGPKYVAHACESRGSGDQPPLPQRSIVAMLASSWRSPAAGVRSLRRAICSTLSSIASAAVFSSTRETRLVPGIGAMSSPCASSQAKAIGAGVAPTPEATAPAS